MDFLLIDHPNLQEKKPAFKYPYVVSELLSTANDKVFEYFALAGADDALPNFERLFDPVVDSAGTVRTAEVNFTRVGYIQKILNNLLNGRPGTFVGYLFKKNIFLKGAIRHAYCKSMSSFLLNILILGLCAGPAAPGPMGAVAAEVQNGEAAGGKPVANPALAGLLTETLADRLMIFGEIIQECVLSAESEEHADLNSNFAAIIMSILSRDFAERPQFLQTFKDHLDLIISAFVDTYPLPNNNKLGNIFLVFLEIAYRDFEKDATAVPIDLPKLEGYTRSYFKLLLPSRKEPATPESAKPKRRTSSFPAELPKANLKIYKVLEALLMILKAHLGKPDFDQEVFLHSGFEHFVFQLFQQFPFNNILHNQLKKFLVTIVEQGSADLNAVYFVNNADFARFLADVADNKFVRSFSNKNVKVGFVGQLVAVVSAIAHHAELSAALNQSEVTRRAWADFLARFYAVELAAENQVLGDIDFKVDDEIVFFCSIEEVKKHFQNFLGLSTDGEAPESDGDEILDEILIGDNHDILDEKDHPWNEKDEPRHAVENKDKERDREALEDLGLKQEIRDLDTHSAEDVFADYKYWKPVIDYNVDDLISEIKK